LEAHKRQSCSPLEQADSRNRERFAVSGAVGAFFDLLATGSEIFFVDLLDGK
jgi:hypothetical protein